MAIKMTMDKILNEELYIETRNYELTERAINRV